MHTFIAPSPASPPSLTHSITVFQPSYVHTSTFYNTVLAVHRPLPSAPAISLSNPVPSQSHHAQAPAIEQLVVQTETLSHKATCKAADNIWVTPGHLEPSPVHNTATPTNIPLAHTTQP